ncbi:hypothetical protein [Lapillicoccus jejuensis]|uniref:Lipoprotein n=1 Tax=Lapillicoccus jejuensis TaxID=402171 RepID=A0A542E2U1_9MICO|nr:hypothetical protein [Lapillicoccus jejuensis]TQJ09658.1 hypothetical protein FB458_2771 [Lapillicoccus jejuensis]
MSRSSRRALLAGTALAAALGLGACGVVVGVGPAPTATVGGVLDSARAQEIATRVVGQARQAAATPGAVGDALRTAAFTGDALVAARADAKLASATASTVKAQRELVAAAPSVLAVSRGASYPRTIVAQSRYEQSDLPVLLLLVTPDARTSYRIAASVGMLPGTQVPGFDQVSTGSAGLGAADVADGGRYGTLLDGYASSLAYPAPTSTTAPGVAAGDRFASAVRTNAAAQAKAVAAIGSFRQVHDLRSVVGGLHTADGRGALVFATLDRSDTLLVRSGTLRLPSTFTVLSGLSSVSSEADLTTLEVVALVVPPDGDATVVGGEEHLYAASGA